MRAKLFLLFIVLILGALAFSVYKKEQQLAGGRTIYLAILPADPRSILQGDYMALRYASINYYDKNTCFAVDERGVILHRSEIEEHSVLQNCLNAGYVWLKNSPPRSFFFQEGHAHLYENAKYAVLKYDGKDSVVLKALADNYLGEIKP